MEIGRRQFVISGGALLAGPVLTATAAPDEQKPWGDLLSRSFPPEKLAAVLLPTASWQPFPSATDRAAWGALPPDARHALVTGGEKRTGAAWPPLPATVFLEYQRVGNRSNYEQIRGARREQLAALVLAECVQGEGRLLDDIANGIWATCEETFWGVPAHLNMQKAGAGLPDAAEPVVDLFAAETSSLLAWTDYLLGSRLDPVSPLLRPRMRSEIERRMLAPCLSREDFWWMGLDPNGRAELNNWTPWIVSNWLTSALLVATDARRCAAVHKSLRSLDRFLASYHEDGGCDEGPGYWFRAGGSLFDCLELLHSASKGAIDFYGVPLIREIGLYICRAHIYEDYFVNFADASAKVRMAGDLVFRYGRRIGEARMQAHGAFAAERAGWLPAPGDSMGRQLAAFFNLTTLQAAPRRQPLLRDAWFPGIQVMAARKKDGSAEGLYLAAQGGHNAESHNHNDVGNFIVYADGRPAVIDVGVETYTAKTFSPQRYEIWTMQSGYHNLPTIDGVMQSAGRTFAARDVSYRANETAAELSLDISGAFPPTAHLQSWRRRLRLDRARNVVEVQDTYVLTRAAGRISQTLMTACRPVQTAPGELTLAGEPFPSGKVKILFDPAVFTPSTEEIGIADSRLRSAWGERVYRTLLTASAPGLRGDWTVRVAQS